MDTIIIDHLVEFPKDDLLFVRGRDKDSNRLRLFLVFNHNGPVYKRHANSWQTLGAHEADVVRHKVEHAGRRYISSGSPEVCLS